MKTLESAFRTDDFWPNVATIVISQIKARTADGLDSDGKPFRTYTKGYSTRKAAGFYNKDGKRTQYKGIALSRQTAPANFRLTGKVMRALRVLYQTPKGITVGWHDREAVIVDAHMEKSKGYKVGGLSPDNFDFLVDKLDTHFTQKWETNSIITIKGKK